MEGKINYKGIVEKWLYNYESEKLRVDALKTLYEEKLSMAGSGADPLRERTSKTYKFNSETENTAIELTLIKDRIKHMERKLEIIDNGLSSLSEGERIIIDEKYIKCHSWEQVIDNAHYSMRWCKELKKRAINKLIETMFGDVLLHENDENTSLPY